MSAASDAKVPPVGHQDNQVVGNFEFLSIRQRLKLVLA